MNEEISPKVSQLEEFWTVKEVAEYLRFKPSTIYEMVSSKSIPFTRFGRKVLRFRKRDIDQWIRMLSVKPSPEMEQIEKSIKKSIEDKPPLDVYQIVKKCIAEVKKEGYPFSLEKPDKDKGLGKEVDHGTL